MSRDHRGPDAAGRSTQVAAAALGAQPGKRTLTEAIVQPPGAPSAAAASPAQDPGQAQPLGLRAFTPGGGQPLPGSVRSQMEAPFGADFSAVRIHEGAHVADAGARAYTHGADVHFAPGQYDPSSAGGRELLGHELAHVVQQSSGRVAPTVQYKGMAINDDDALEREADDWGARAARGQAVPASPGSIGPASSGVVQGKFTIKGGGTFDSANAVRGNATAKRKAGADLLPIVSAMAAAEKDFGSASWDQVVSAAGAAHAEGLTATSPELVDRVPAFLTAATASSGSKRKAGGAHGGSAKRVKLEGATDADTEPEGQAESRIDDELPDGFANGVKTTFQTERTAQQGNDATSAYRAKLLKNSSQPHRDLDRAAFTLEKLNPNRVCTAVGLEEDDTESKDRRLQVFANVPDAKLGPDAQSMIRAIDDRDTRKELLGRLSGQQASRLKKTPENEAKRDAAQNAQDKKHRRRFYKSMRGLHDQGLSEDAVGVPNANLAEPIHGEQQATDWAHKNNKQFKDMGISKLCCAKCWNALQAAKAADIHPNLATGSHQKTYDSSNGWPVPPYLLGNDTALKAFLGDAAYTTYSDCDKACRAKCMQWVKERKLDDLQGHNTTDIVSSDEEFSEDEFEAHVASHRRPGAADEVPMDTDETPVNQG